MCTRQNLKKVRRLLHLLLHPSKPNSHHPLAPLELRKRVVVVEVAMPGVVVASMLKPLAHRVKDKDKDVETTKMAVVVDGGETAIVMMRRSELARREVDAAAADPNASNVSPESPASTVSRESLVKLDLLRRSALVRTC